MMTNPNLPDLPSALIRVALTDLQVIQKNPAYKIRMSMWHMTIDEDEETICQVCLAGAVMANTLNADITRDISPNDYSTVDARKLDALDDFRSGHVGRAFAVLNIPHLPTIPWYVVIDPYDPDCPSNFINDMSDLANTLEKAGY
tara:strand:+ start:112 stop:543 length:432 start_codon:yes stop_codon:yes gene_type:complete